MMFFEVKVQQIIYTLCFHKYKWMNQVLLHIFEYLRRGTVDVFEDKSTA